MRTSRGSKKNSLGSIARRRSLQTTSMPLLPYRLTRTHCSQIHEALNKGQKTKSLRYNRFKGETKTIRLTHFQASSKPIFGLPLEESICFYEKPVLPVDHEHYDEELKKIIQSDVECASFRLSEDVLTKVLTEKVALDKASLEGIDFRNYNRDAHICVPPERILESENRLGIENGQSKSFADRGLAIECINGPHKGEEYIFDLGRVKTVVIGSRSTSSTYKKSSVMNVAWTDHGIHPQHARLQLQLPNIRQSTMMLHIEALSNESQKATCINGKPVKKVTEAFIDNNITIGENEFRVKKLERTAQFFEEEIYYGTIDEFWFLNGKSPLWHVTFDDGDSMDFNKEEIMEARKLYKRRKNDDPATKKNAIVFDQAAAVVSTSKPPEIIDLVNENYSETLSSPERQDPEVREKDEREIIDLDLLKTETESRLKSPVADESSLLERKDTANALVFSESYSVIKNGKNEKQHEITRKLQFEPSLESLLKDIFGWKESVSQHEVLESLRHMQVFNWTQFIRLSREDIESLSKMTTDGQRVPIGSFSKNQLHTLRAMIRERIKRNLPNARDISSYSAAQFETFFFKLSERNETLTDTAPQSPILNSNSCHGKLPLDPTESNQEALRVVKDVRAHEPIPKASMAYAMKELGDHVTKQFQKNQNGEKDHSLSRIKNHQKLSEQAVSQDSMARFKNIDALGNALLRSPPKIMSKSSGKDVASDDKTESVEAGDKKRESKKTKTIRFEESKLAFGKRLVKKLKHVRFEEPPIESRNVAKEPSNAPRRLARSDTALTSRGSNVDANGIGSMIAHKTHRKWKNIDSPAVALALLRPALAHSPVSIERLQRDYERKKQTNKKTKID